MSRFAPFWEILKVVAIVFISAIVIRGFVAQPFIVEGSSMEPDFHNGEYLLIEKMSYHLRPPSRGDVIVFKYPNNPNVNYIKRIIGLPGETVEIRDGKVFIKTGQTETTWNYPDIATEALGDNGHYPLGPGQYFVLGDNRGMSLDSRAWGSVDQKLIRGRVFVRLFPFNRLGLLPADVSDKPANAS